MRVQEEIDRDGWGRRNAANAHGGCGRTRGGGRAQDLAQMRTACWRLNLRHVLQIGIKAPDAIEQTCFDVKRSFGASRLD